MRLPSYEAPSGFSQATSVPLAASSWRLEPTVFQWPTLTPLQSPCELAVPALSWSALRVTVQGSSWLPTLSFQAPVTAESAWARVIEASARPAPRARADSLV